MRIRIDLDLDLNSGARKSALVLLALAIGGGAHYGLLGGAMYGGSAVEAGGAGIFAAAYTDSIMTQQPRIGVRCMIRP